jgi:hypothetical protein
MQIFALPRKTKDAQLPVAIDINLDIIHGDPGRVLSLLPTHAPALQQVVIPSLAQFKITSSDYI